MPDAAGMRFFVVGRDSVFAHPVRHGLFQLFGAIRLELAAVRRNDLVRARTVKARNGAAILLIRAWPLGWYHSNASVLIFWGCSAMIAGAAAVFKLPVWPIVATLVASGAAMVTGVDRDSSLYVVSLVLALGVLAYGVRKLKLSYANIGAALLLWLILAKFFASHLDFTVKGLVLILSGAAITVLNVVFIRLRKRSA